MSTAIGGQRADRVPMVDADEHDALGFPARYLWRPGERKAIKRRYNRRVRRAWKS